MAVIGALATLLIALAAMVPVVAYVRIPDPPKTKKAPR